MVCVYIKLMYEILIIKKESYELKGFIFMNIFIVYKFFYNFIKMFEEGSVVIFLVYFMI